MPETDTTVSGKTRNWYMFCRNDHFWRQKLSLVHCTKVYQRLWQNFVSTASNLMKQPWQPMIKQHKGLDDGKCYAFQTLKLSLKGVKELAWKKKWKKRIRNWIKNRMQKSHSKLTFFWKKWFFQMLQSTAYALFQSQTVLRKRMAKKEEKFIELFSFLMQKTTKQKKQKNNNQTYLLTSERSVTS